MQPCWQPYLNFGSLLCFLWYSFIPLTITKPILVLPLSWIYSHLLPRHFSALSSWFLFGALTSTPSDPQVQTGCGLWNSAALESWHKEFLSAFIKKHLKSLPKLRLCVQKNWFLQECLSYQKHFWWIFPSKSLLCFPSMMLWVLLVCFLLSSWEEFIYKTFYFFFLCLFSNLPTDGKLKMWVYGVSASGFLIIALLIFTSFLMWWVWHGVLGFVCSLVFKI